MQSGFSVVLPAFDFEGERGEIVRLIRDTGAFKHSPDKPFELASAETSAYYFDLRLLNGDPAGLCAVAAAFYGRIRERMPDVRSIGGLESGSIPIASAVSQLSRLAHMADPANPSIASFYVRKEPKRRGTKKLIEGRVVSPVVIVDDVVTSGGSAVSAITAVKNEGHACRCLMAIVFRGDDEARRGIERHSPLWYIFEKDRLVEQLAELDG